MLFYTNFLGYFKSIDNTVIPVVASTLEFTVKDTFYTLKI